MATTFLFGIEPNLEIRKKTAVVGSSKELLNKPGGKLIDSFDDVIRFNGAVTEKFSEFVGHKTTIQVIGVDIAYLFSAPYVSPSGDVRQSDSENRLINAGLIVENNPDAKIITWRGDNPKRIAINRQYDNANIFEKACPQIELFYFCDEGNPHFLKEYWQGNRILEKLGLKSRLCRGGMRTGFRIVLKLILSGVTPTLFGFDIDPSLSIAMHYHDDITRCDIKEHPNHDIQGEMLALSEMCSKGMISIP